MSITNYALSNLITVSRQSTPPATPPSHPPPAPPPGAEGRLPRRRLAKPGGKHAAHHDLLDPVRVDPRPPHGLADRRRTELGGAQARQATEEGANRRPGVGTD